MPKYDKIEELLSDLYQHRKLFSALFEYRLTTISEDALLGVVEGKGDKLDRLSAYELVVRNHGTVQLESRLQDFLVEYMEVDETVHVLHIQENLDEIKKLQSYYLKEQQGIKKERYLIKIKKNLREIIRIAALNVKTLRNNMEETYKTESNFDLKRDKLDDIRSQRDALEGVIRAVEKMLEDEFFFRSASDEELLYLMHRLRVMLRESRHNLIEVQHQIIAYLNQIEKRVAVVDKVLRLKVLRDKHYLRQQTNFYQLAARNVDLPITKSDPLRSRLSIADLQQEESMQELVLKVKGRRKHRKMMEANRAGVIPHSAFADEKKTESMINLVALKNMFLKRSGDLFSFVIEHDFSDSLTESQRISIFCQLASRFSAEFEFPDQTQEYDGLEVAVVYGKRV